MLSTFRPGEFRLILIVAVLSACWWGGDLHAQSRTISFSGISWIVRDTGLRREGPGDNLWYGGEDAVRVDDRGLHLAIRNVEGAHRSVEIYTRHPVPGYGRYSFTVETPSWQPESYLVLGFFLYQYRGADETPQEYELDIEFSRWGIDASPLGHYTVMYREPRAALSRIPSYSFDPPARFRRTTHEIIWSPGKASFHSFARDASGKVHTIAKTTFEGSYIHPLQAQRLHINFWLFGGPQPPPEWQREIVITEVSICIE